MEEIIMLRKIIKLGLLSSLVLVGLAINFACNKIDNKQSSTEELPNRIMKKRMLSPCYKKGEYWLIHLNQFSPNSGGSVVEPFWYKWEENYWQEHDHNIWVVVYGDNVSVDKLKEKFVDSKIFKRPIDFRFIHYRDFLIRTSENALRFAKLIKEDYKFEKGENPDYKYKECVYAWLYRRQIRFAEEVYQNFIADSFRHESTPKDRLWYKR